MNGIYLSTGTNLNPSLWGDAFSVEIKKKEYFICENCGSRYLLPELKGNVLIHLVCSACNGRLKEEAK